MAADTPALKVICLQTEVDAVTEKSTEMFLRHTQFRAIIVNVTEATVTSEQNEKYSILGVEAISLCTVKFVHVCSSSGDSKGRPGWAMAPRDFCLAPQLFS